MKVSFAFRDKERIFINIIDKNHHHVLDSFIEKDTERIWLNRLDPYYAQIETEDNIKHLYVKGVVDGMTMLFEFMEDLYNNPQYNIKLGECKCGKCTR